MRERSRPGTPGGLRQESVARGYCFRGLFQTVSILARRSPRLLEIFVRAINRISLYSARRKYDAFAEFAARMTIIRPMDKKRIPIAFSKERIALRSSLSRDQFPNGFPHLAHDSADTFRCSIPEGIFGLFDQHYAQIIRSIAPQIETSRSDEEEMIREFC